MEYLGKLGLVLADIDKDYIGSLSDYLIKRHAQSFDIYMFTSAESLAAFFSVGMKRVNIIIAGPAIIAAGIPAGSSDIVICLEDGKACGGREGMSAINRYQHAEKLIAAIFGMYSEKCTAGGIPAGVGNTLITAFISPAGGLGKSTISAGCSLFCSRRGLKVFYLNLEDVPSTGLFFKGDSDQSFSNVLYYLKDKDRNRDMKLAGARCADVSNGVHFFLPPESPFEMSSLLPVDATTLLDCFRLYAAYDAIFVDMPGRLDERGIAVLNASDRVVCICGTDSASRLKLQAFQAELELLANRYVPGLTEKAVYVVNDSRGLGYRDFFDTAGREPAVVFERFNAYDCTADGFNLTDCGINFNSRIGMLLGYINPEWAAGRYFKAEGETFNA